MRKTIYPLLACQFLLSCTAGPDYRKPEIFTDSELKEELNLNKAYDVPVNWYTQLGDEQLDMLVETAVANSTDIAAAVSRLKQARYLLAVSRVGGLPIINAHGGYKYEKNSRSIGYVQDTHYYTAGFDASWELDLWGKNRRDTEAAEAQLLQAEYTLDDVRVSVAAETVSLYINLMMTMEKLRIAEHNSKLQSDIFSTVSKKYRNGLADSMTYHQAEYLLENTRSAIPELKSEAESYRNALAVLSGILPSALPVNMKKCSPLFTGTYKYDGKMVYNLPADVIRRRPDVAAAEQNLVAQNALIGKAVAELYPDISLTALWGYAASGGNSLFNSRSQGYNYAPLVTFPLLDWNRLKNNIEIQKQKKNEALTEYRHAVLNAVAELKNAMEAYQNEIKSNYSHKRAFYNMQKVAEAAKKRYLNGLIEFSELLDTEQKLLAAQNEYLESRAGIFLNLAAYYKASGGGYLL